MMKRLTKLYSGKDKDFEGSYICNYNKNCNDSCLYNACKWREEATQKLAEYENAEEQGLLVRLPASVGSDVYKICPQSNHLKMGDMWDGRLITTECQMCAWEMCDCYDIGYQQDRKNHIIRKMKANNAEWLIKIKPYFGIIYFATEAEALQALKEREENQ